MPIDVACPKCGQPFKAPKDASNQIVNCPRCESSLTLPQSTENVDSPVPCESDRDAPVWIWAVVVIGACVPIALMLIAIFADPRPCESVTETSGRTVSAPSSLSETKASNGQSTVRPSPGDPGARDTEGRTSSNETKVAGDSAVTSTDRETFYNAQRDPPYLANKVSGHQTRSGAIAALAAQFDESPAWVEANMGSSNSLTEIHSSLARAKIRAPTRINPQVGRVDYSLVQTLKLTWRRKGLRYKSRAEQSQAMALMVLTVQADIKDPADQQATLDYIQQTIDSW